MFSPDRQGPLGAKYQLGALWAAARLCSPAPCAQPRVRGGEDATASTRARSLGAAGPGASVGGGRPPSPALSADRPGATSPAMNRLGARLVGASAIPPPPPKPRGNENLDKIDMSLGEEPTWTELGVGGGCGWDQEPRFVGEGAVCGGRGGWSQWSVEFLFLRVGGTEGGLRGPGAPGSNLRARPGCLRGGGGGGRAGVGGRCGPGSVEGPEVRSLSALRGLL